VTVCGVMGGVLGACSLLVFIGYDVKLDLHWCSLVSDACSLTAAMPDKRMRPIVKQEPGAGCAQELPQQQQAAATAAGEREGQHHRIEDEAAEGGVELGLQLLRANADVQAIALQWMERERAMGEELLQSKAQVAELRAEIRIKDAALESEVRSREAKDAVHKAHVVLLESKLLSKDDALEAKDAAHKAVKAKVAILESELLSKEAALQAQIFGRYAAPGKHLVSGPYPAASQRQHPHSNRRTLNNVHAPLHSESVTVLQQSWHPRLPL
jgi:hypothetical protein